MNRGLIGVTLVLCLATGLATACSSNSTGAQTSAGAPEMADNSGGGGDAPSTDQGKESAAGGDRDVSQPGVDRKLVRTATIELAAADVGETVNDARDIAATEGGYAGSEDVSEQSASLTLLIPSDRFDSALDELSALGKVISRKQTAEDVTEQVVDLESRIATQRASVNRVRELLARATTVDEIVRIEQEVTTREADLESLEQRRQALAGQVAMSTVTIEVSKTAAAAPVAQDEPDGLLAGLSDGWGAFLDFGAGTLRVIGAMLPFLLVLAVPAVPALRWWRRRRTPASVVQQS